MAPPSFEVGRDPGVGARHRRARQATGYHRLPTSEPGPPTTVRRPRPPPRAARSALIVRRRRRPPTRRRIEGALDDPAARVEAIPLELLLVVDLGPQLIARTPP